MTRTSAFLLSLYVAVSYVAAIYTTSRDLEDYPSGRDDPRVIRRRMKRITLVVLMNMFLIPWLISRYGDAEKAVSFREAVLDLGVVPGYRRNGIWDIVGYLQEICRAISLIGLLYVGPLTDAFLYYLLVPGKHWYTDFKEEMFNIWGLRNYVFAPITEEIVYTSMLVNIYCSTFPADSPVRLKTVIWKTPLFFGVAHLHHAYEMQRQGVASFATILFSCTLQIAYTTLFGSLTNYTFLRTGGNLWACIAIHALCNFLGFPESSKLAMHYTVVKKVDSPHLSRLLNIWKKCYLALLVMGLLFAKNMYQVLLQSDGNQIVL
ncbi:hypothetical protein HG536_0H00660 [Torulaspora globosa]|uniref:intramembrane prenyl-peptidase Rce1 n=1 Tax=Torulaspora globosa TaxID=48254 RepID=A0A7G3ZMF5_9SACH|nr:uncharacterized protein HG536_0H00660 [Torulaspora globosa]QLL34691.1 hypothetical protein HG536_0H00660 [Torulaspora globosa]